jgi:hypothetical protein
MRIENNWDWKTHQPLIRAAMELYKPKFVLELGIGIHSTPVFLEYKTKWQGIENDKEWMDLIKEKYNVPVTFHDLGSEVNIATYLRDLPKTKQEEIYYYYQNLKLPKLKPNLLFVDQFTCNRTLSINALSNRFNLIIYHDCNPEWYEKEYEYNLIGYEGFNNYFLKTNITWTGIMINKEVDKGFDSLRTIINPHIKIFQQQNNNGYMELCV